MNTSSKRLVESSKHRRAYWEMFVNPALTVTLHTAYSKRQT